MTLFKLELILTMKHVQIEWQKKMIQKKQIKYLLVSQKILGEKAFQFSPTELITIHKRLFEGILPHAGKIRNYNI